MTDLDANLCVCVFAVVSSFSNIQQLRDAPERALHFSVRKSNSRYLCSLAKPTTGIKVRFFEQRRNSQIAHSAR